MAVRVVRTMKAMRPRTKAGRPKAQLSDKSAADVQAEQNPNAIGKASDEPRPKGNAKARAAVLGAAADIESFIANAADEAMTEARSDSEKSEDTLKLGSPRPKKRKAEADGK